MAFRIDAMKPICLWIAGVFCYSAGALAEPTPLQPILDAAAPNDTVVLEPGVYSGPAVLEKSLVLDGQGQATIDAGGTGTVLLVSTDGATIQNLRFTNSGESHNDIDSGIQVRGRFNVIKDNVIDNTLFGIDLQDSQNNIVRRNRISSKPFDLGMRGDAIRLWYSFENKITDNEITDSRDTVVWYSRDNIISRNKATRGRYSLHFMYSQENLVEDNEYFDNTVGIFLMYSDGVKVRRNLIAHANGATGVGIGFKETSNVIIEDNRVLYCATGLYLDVSPYQPDTTNMLKRNLVAYNGIGIRFLNDWTGNIFEENVFKGNLTQVAVSGGHTANRNTWSGNFWDNYEGFDRNHDGIGDSPFEQYAYADRIWMDVPPAQFFQGSPTLSLLDFLERLAPFSTPDLLLRDSRPLMEAKAKQ